MTSRSILWTLLLVATVRARSEVSITEAGLDTENKWSQAPVAEAEENASKTDTNNQNNADFEEAILSRIGLDTLIHPIGSSRLSDSDGANLEKSLDEKLQDISDTLSRLSGLEPNEESDTNYDSLANSKTGEANSDEVRNDILEILNDDLDDVSVSGVLGRSGILNGLNRNIHSVHPVTVRRNRNHKPGSYFNVRDSGYNKWNINERNGMSHTDQNIEKDLLLTRIAALDGLKESKLNNLNSLLHAKNIGLNAVNRRNHLFDIRKNVPSRRFIGKQGLINNDLESVKTNADQDLAAIEEIIATRRNLVDLEKVNRNHKNLNVRKNNVLNNLESNILDDKNLNSDIDAELASIIVNSRSGNNGILELNKISNLADDSNLAAIEEIIATRRNLVDLEKVNRNLKNFNVRKNNVLNKLESNILDDKNLNSDIDAELARIIVNSRSGNSGILELNNISNLADDSNVVNDHLSKHESRRNRNGIKKVSLNDLNDAKRLLGPFSLDKVAVANRVSDEIDGALLNALNTENDFNALGALAVLNKAAAKASEDLLLNNIIGRSDNDVESTLLSKLRSTEDSDVNGITSSNRLQEALNSLIVLSRIDSTNDEESSINSEYSPENLSRSHKNLLHNLVDSKWSTKLENKISEDEVDEVDSLLSRRGNSWNRNSLGKFGLRNKPKRPYKLFKRYRTNKPQDAPSYLYRSGLNSELTTDEKLGDLVNLSKLAKLNNIANERNVENELSVDDLLSTIDKNGVSDVSAADLSEAQLKNLIALHDLSVDQVQARNHLKHVSDLDDEKSVRHSVSKLDKDLRDAKNLLLAGSLSNLKEQRRTVSGKSKLRLLGEEKNGHDDVVLVPVRVGSGSIVNRAGGLHDLSKLIDMNVVH